MPVEPELYRLEMESANRIFGNEEFLSINKLSKRIGKSYEATRCLFAERELPNVGISRARYAYALSKRRK